MPLIVSRSRTRWIGILLLATVALAVPAAQEPQSSQQPVFRSGVDSVTVDVSVVDRDGNPITDLTAADFEIREAGKPQAVTTFKLVQTGDGLDDARAEREI